MSDRIFEKLKILADAAKYDVSCSSSGSSRKNENKGLGDATGTGICHAYTEDGRCVSLLKILLTNHCIFDCAYCVSRRSNDIKRAAFTVQEVVDLTINFYRRNYIEGLFLSSGIFSNADYTMERLILIAKKLRTEHKFNGYIHLKAIPGASDELMQQAGLYADRLSVNVEMPTESSLRLLAPDKKRSDMLQPMVYLKKAIQQNRDDKKTITKTPMFVPAGQSTQMVIGATPETDFQILDIANQFYSKMQLKRVYYSGYVPISNDNRLPALGTPVPMVRENRLYQADWLLRFYGFRVQELVSEEQPLLDMDIDPKLAWALRNLNLFPLDINKADLSVIKRVPGIGVQSALKIVSARRFNLLNWDHLKKIGIAINRARYFITCNSPDFERKDYLPMQIKQFILSGELANTDRIFHLRYLYSDMRTVVYDGSFAGWLTAVFDIYDYKFTDVSIVPESRRQDDLFNDAHIVATDETKSNRVWNGLKQYISNRSSNSLYKAFLSELKGTEDMLLRYVQYAFSKKVNMEYDYSHPAVLFAVETARKVHREKHRMEAFVRFQKTQDNLFYAVIDPDFNVLPLIQPHFERRYADQHWMIYDIRRKYGLYYDLQQTTVVEVNFNEGTGQNITSIYDEKEPLYQQLWHHYFDSVNIKARKNTQLHVRHMPLRYWKYLPEKKPL